MSKYERPAYLDDEMGNCPECGRTSGCLSVGSDHWHYCCEHQTKWRIGSNLFASSRDLSEEDWARNDATLSGYCKVLPVFPHPKNPWEALGYIQSRLGWNTKRNKATTEQLNELLRTAEAYARETMIGTTTGLSRSSYVFTMSADGTEDLLPAKWSTGIGKELAFAKTLQAMRERGVVAGALLAEIWHGRGPSVRPSLDPERKEYVIILATDGGKTVARSLDIVRDYMGTIQLLTASSDSNDPADGSGASGPFAGLLPVGPPLEIWVDDHLRVVPRIPDKTIREVTEKIARAHDESVEKIQKNLATLVLAKGPEHHSVALTILANLGWTRLTPETLVAFCERHGLPTESVEEISQHIIRHKKEPDTSTGLSPVGQLVRGLWRI
jgi:hypothetical protein